MQQYQPHGMQAQLLLLQALLWPVKQPLKDTHTLMPDTHTLLLLMLQPTQMRCTLHPACTLPPFKLLLQEPPPLQQSICCCC
jgi:hypothetical protein